MRHLGRADPVLIFRRGRPQFVALVEAEVGVPVRIVGTGPARDAVLEWQ